MHISTATTSAALLVRVLEDLRSSNPDEAIMSLEAGLDGFILDLIVFGQMAPEPPLDDQRLRIWSTVKRYRTAHPSAVLEHEEVVGDFWKSIPDAVTPPG